MKILKKFLCLLAFTGLILTVSQAKAADMVDVPESYWAIESIAEVVNDGIMTLDSNGNFNPEKSVKRGEFTSMLLKTLNHKNIEPEDVNSFTDITKTTEFYPEILKSQSIGLIYGYPDGTFRPEQNMTRAEVNSVMSHITKEAVNDTEILDEFIDTNLLPRWSVPTYAKTVKYDLYVNHPNPMKFEPNRNITRAETAVLLAKLKKSLNLVKEEYKADASEKTLGIEHLNTYADADVNIVTITNLRKIIAAGNVIPAEFAQTYKSKVSSEGESLVFVIKNDIVTQEGTLVIPGGTKLNAVVEDLIAPKWFNKNGEVKVQFTSLEFADGSTSDLEGYVLNDREGYLKEGPWKKLGAYTLGGLVAGAGAGLGVGVPTDELGSGLAIGLPVGAGAGFATGLVTKGTYFTGKAGDKVFVKLLSNVSIMENL